MSATPVSLEVSRGTGPDGARTTHLPTVRGSAIDGHGWSAGDARNRMQIMELEVMARTHKRMPHCGRHPSVAGREYAGSQSAMRLAQ